MTIKIYHHPVSTCSQKVRLVLAEKGLTYEQHIIDWTIMEHLQDWYLEINPNGVVPTLVHDGQPVVDSSVICEYIDETWPNPPLSPAETLSRARMRAWMRYFEEVPTAAIRAPSFNALFSKAIKGSRSEADYEAMTARMPVRKHFYRQMGDDGFPQAVVDDSLDRLRSCLTRVARTLGDGRPFILGEAYTIADVVLIPSVVRMTDLGLAHLWRTLPEIDLWLENVTARPSFDVAYMPGSRVNPRDYSLDQGNDR